MGSVLTCQAPNCTWPDELLTPIRVDVPSGGELELVLCPLHADVVAGTFETVAKVVDDIGRAADWARYWRTHVGLDGWSVRDELDGDLIAYVSSEEVAVRVEREHNTAVDALNEAASWLGDRHSPLWPRSARTSSPAAEGPAPAGARSR